MKAVGLTGILKLNRREHEMEYDDRDIEMQLIDSILSKSKSETMIDPAANIARFEKAYEALAEQNWLVRQLQEQGIGYEKLAPHLQKDADKRMGIVRWVNVPIFEDDNEGE